MNTWLMNNKKWIGFLLLALAILILLKEFFEQKNLQNQLNQIEEAYQKGEKAKTLNERKKVFNTALEGYMQLEKEYDPKYGDGKFYYNLGNTYFQLEEYPLAILNYEKGINLLSDATKAEANLAIARQKLGIVEKKEPPVFEYLLFLQKWPLPFRLQLLSVCSLLLFLTLSVNLWRAVPGLKSILFVLGIIFLALLGSVAYSRFFASVHAIVIRPGYIYRDAGMQYAKVKEDPLTPGVKVQILGYSPEDGGWMKIMAPQNEFGFIKGADVQIINPYR